MRHSFWPARLVCYFTLFLLWWVGGPAGCGISTPTSPAEIPGPLAMSDLGAKIAAAASALIPTVTGSSSETVGGLTPSDPTYGTSDQWTTYLEPENVSILTDIFGSESGIRLLVGELVEAIEGLAATDPSLTGEGAAALTDADTIDLPLLGTISNGDSTDRYFDWISGSPDKVALYGGVDTYEADGAGGVNVITVAVVKDKTEENTTDVATLGDSAEIRSVFAAAYGETTSDGTTIAYLDLHMAQSLVYNGPDNTFDTPDDVPSNFRMRTTGRVPLDGSGNPTSSAGDFTATREEPSATTKTLGRGNYMDHFVFKIDDSTLPELATQFCLKAPGSGDEAPAWADSANCSSYLSDYPWGDIDFPVDLLPVEQDFAEKSFLESADLIDPDTFSIPAYPASTLANGESCSTDMQCASAYCGEEGETGRVCRENGSGHDGEVCSTDAQCKSGSCNSGTCTFACSGLYEFNVSDELSCFSLYNASINSITGETLPGSFLDSTIIADNKLTLDLNTVSSSFGTGSFFLAQPLAPGDFSVEMAVIGGIPANVNESIGLLLTGTTDAQDMALLQWHFSPVGLGGTLGVEAGSMVNGGDGGIQTFVPLGAWEIYLRLSRTGSTLTYAYKTDESADWTVLTSESRTTPGDILGGDTEPLLIGIIAWTENALGTFAPEIERFHVEGGTIIP